MILNEWNSYLNLMNVSKKNYDENNDKGNILEEDLKYQKKNYLIFMVTYCFYLKEKKLKNARSFFVTYITKKTMLYTKEP